jgi:hypothetical protein
MSLMTRELFYLFIYLFVYVLWNNAVSTLGNWASNNISEKDLEGSSHDSNIPKFFFNCRNPSQDG